MLSRTQWGLGLWFLLVLLIACWWPLPERDRAPASVVRDEPAQSAASTTELVATSQSNQSPVPKVVRTGHQETPPPLAHASATPIPHDELSRLVQGHALRLNGREMQRLRARAVPNASYHSSMGPVLFQLNGFSVVAMPEENSAVADLRVRAGDRPVLLDSANGRPGIISGTLIVELKDMHAAESLAGRQNLRLLYKDDSISRIYLRAADDVALDAQVKALKGEPEVASVEIEVLRGVVGRR